MKAGTSPTNPAKLMAVSAETRSRVKSIVVMASQPASASSPARSLPTRRRLAIGRDRSALAGYDKRALAGRACGTVFEESLLGRRMQLAGLRAGTPESVLTG